MASKQQSMAPTPGLRHARAGQSGRRCRGPVDALPTNHRRNVGPPDPSFADSIAMRITRSALLLTVLSLTACGSGSKSAGPAVAEPVEKPAEEPSVLPSDFALPVTAPMRARERLLHDLEQRKDAARQRANQFDEILELNR